MSVKSKRVLKDALPLGLAICAYLLTILILRSTGSQNTSSPWQLSKATGSLDKKATSQSSNAECRAIAGRSSHGRLLGTLKSNRLESEKSTARGQTVTDSSQAMVQRTSRTNSHKPWNHGQRPDAEIVSRKTRYSLPATPDHPLNSTHVRARKHVRLQKQQAPLVQALAHQWDASKRSNQAGVNGPATAAAWQQNGLHQIRPENTTSDSIQWGSALASYELAQPEAHQTTDQSTAKHYEAKKINGFAELDSAYKLLAQNPPPPKPIRSAANAIAVIPTSEKSRSVRKVNWESIDPLPTVGENKTEPTTVPTLPRVTSSPEAESQALRIIEDGKALANRGANFAAKVQFIKALNLVAHSNDRYPSDQNKNGKAYSNSLTQGLTALKESGDFVSNLQTSSDPRGNFELILASHSTKIIDPDFVHMLSTQKAIEVYSEFAEPCLELAVGESMAGSSALYHLSRLLSKAPEIYGESADNLVNVQKALLKASLEAYPPNFDSANELGVICFDAGQFNQSVHWFLEAIRHSGGKKRFWRNLAEAHKRAATVTRNKNEHETHLHRAKLALKEAQAAPLLQKADIVPAGWVSLDQFQQDAGVQAPMVQPQGATNTSSIPPTIRQTDSLKRRISDKFKDWF